MPKYPLMAMREAANEKKIVYLGRKAEVHMTNMGYLHTDIVRCIDMLKGENFYRTEFYPSINMVFDVYKTTCTTSSGKQKELCIKLRLTSNREICVATGFIYL